MCRPEASGAQAICTGRVVLGALIWKTAVFGSGVSTFLIPEYSPPKLGPAAHTDSENATSAEVSGVPSLKVTPSRNVNVQVIFVAS